MWLARKEKVEMERIMEKNVEIEMEGVMEMWK